MGDSKVAATGYSFPSGHTLAATMHYGNTAVWQWNKRRWLSITCAVLILLTASVAYTHLTRTGFSDDLPGLLDDAYINYAGLRNEKKQAINAICAVTTDRVINLMLMDGTKNELILKALKKRLTDNRITFDDRVIKKYKGVFFKRS